MLQFLLYLQLYLIVLLQDFLTTGDIICLWTPVVDNKLIPGRWYSSDHSVFLVGQGVAQVIGIKEGIALLSHTLLPAAPLRLNLVPVEKVVMIASYDTVLINTEITSIPLVLKSSKSKNKRSNLVSQTLVLTTEASIHSSFFRLINGNVNPV